MQIKKVSLAICGVGRFAKRRIIPALNSNSILKLSAFITNSDNFEIDENLGIKKYHSLETFLNSKPTGAIYIATPNYLHNFQTVKCLKAGLHVFCEKPMATTKNDCDEMIEIAKNQGLHLQIGHQLRYSPALITAKKWIVSNFIGNVQNIDIKFQYDIPVSARSWAYDSKISGGGCLIDAGVHIIDAIRFLLGNAKIEILKSKTDRANHNDGLERDVDCIFNINDIQCTLKINALSEYSTLLTINGDEGHIHINDFAASWGQVKLKLSSNNNKFIEKLVDVSTIYSDQLKDFSLKILSPNYSYTLAEEAAENVKIVEELYKFELNQ